MVRQQYRGMGSSESTAPSTLALPKQDTGSNSPVVNPRPTTLVCLLLYLKTVPVNTLQHTLSGCSLSQKKRAWFTLTHWPIIFFNSNVNKNIYLILRKKIRFELYIEITDYKVPVKTSF